MPRFHFNIHDGVTAIDRRGRELSGLDEARLEAVRMAGTLMKSEGMRIALGEDWRLEVVDEAGLMLFKFDLFVSSSPYHWRVQP